METVLVTLGAVYVVVIAVQMVGFLTYKKTGLKLAEVRPSESRYSYADSIERANFRRESAWQ